MQTTGRGMGVVRKVAEGNAGAREDALEEEAYERMVHTARVWTAYDPDTAGEHESPPWERELKELIEEGPWPCWDASIPESDFVDPPTYVSFTKAPEKFDPFVDRIKAYKRGVKREQLEMMRATRERVKRERFMSMDNDIRLKNKEENDESEWDHEKIMELIDFPDEVRHKMLSMSVEVYDPRFTYDFTGMGAPPMSTVEFLDSIGRLQRDDETDLERIAKIAERTGTTVPEEVVDEDLGAELQARTPWALQSAIDIGDDENDEISQSEISGLVDSDDEV